MKIRNTLVALILIVGLLVVGCKKPPPPGPTAEEQQVEKLSQTWEIASPAPANAITIEGNDVTSDWTGFTLTISDPGNDSGTYNFSSTNAFSAEVWPSSGTWQFPSDTELNTLIRNDNVDITISVTDETLLMQFEYSTTGGRLNGIDGTWVFNMVAQ